MSTPKENQWMKNAKKIHIDGLKQIFGAEYLATKLFWFIVLISCASICIFLIIGSVNDYLEYNVITTNRYLREKSGVFPTITICPKNTFATEYAAFVYEKIIKDNGINIYKIESFVKNRTGSYLNDEQKQRMNDLNKILIGCNFNSVNCSISDFQWIWHPIFGNCYQFNSGYDKYNKPIELRKSYFGGSSACLTLQLYTGLPNILSQIVSEYNPRGFYLYISNSTDYIYNIVPLPFSLTPGFGVAISVARTFYSQFNEWPYKYSECRVNEKNELIGPPLDDPYLFEQVIATNKSYAQNTCLLFCYQLIMIEECGCNLYEIEFRVPGYDLCDDKEDQFGCKYSFTLANFTQEKLFYKNIDCYSKCPLECNERLLETNVFYYQYPTYFDAYRFSQDPVRLAKYKDQQDFTNLSLLYMNLIEVSVFYQTISYTTIEEKPEITFENLIGTIGGHLHLFLGMSIFSFVEILEMLLSNSAFSFSKISQKCIRKRKETAEARKINKHKNNNNKNNNKRMSI